jgi:hypothetical protein
MPICSKQTRIEFCLNVKEIQIYNNRGMVSKSPLEGGVQERNLAEKYSRYVAATVDRWPRTAAVLRRVAVQYIREGRHSDLRAELEEDFWR